MAIAFCTRRYCGESVIERHDKQLGRVVLVCLACERNAAGLCRDCDAPKQPGNAMRCASCADTRRKRLDRESHARTYAYPEVRDEKLARRREWYAKPENRARMCADQQRRRQGRGKQASTPLDRLYKRTHAKGRYDADARHREKIKARSRKRHRRMRQREIKQKLATGLYRAVEIHGVKGNPNRVTLRLVRITDATPRQERAA